MDLNKKLLDFKKDVLMKCVREINAARENAIKIIRTQTMNNIRLIERSAKTLKDPNPLASTMANISTKYPITIDRKRAKEFSVPRAFLANGSFENKETEDTHYHGRILCKKEVVDWWVSQSSLPTEEMQEVIEILYRPHKKLVEEYYTMGWEKTKISFGPVNLERRLVATNETPFRIDRSLRDQAFKQVILPDYTIPYERIPVHIIDLIREVITSRSSFQISLISQIRIVLESLDPKMRYLPIIPGLMESLAPIKHAIIGDNYVITGYNEKIDKNKDVLKTIIIKFSQCLIHYAKTYAKHIDELNEIVRNSILRDMCIKEIVKSYDFPDTNEMQFMKVLCDVKIAMTSSNEGFETFPIFANLQKKRFDNRSGTMATYYMGMETVRFRYYDNRGHFIHNGELVTKIVMIYTNFKDFGKVMGHIAAYCRVGYRFTTGSYKKAKEEIQKIYEQNPEKLLNLSVRDIREIKNYSGGEKIFGNLELKDRIDINYENKVICQLDSMFNIVGPGGMVIEINIPQEKNLIVPDDIQVNCPPFYDYISLKKLLKFKMDFYMASFLQLKQRIIQAGDYQWHNESIVKHLPKESAHISAWCRDIVDNCLFGDQDCIPEVICFYYCFCYEVPQRHAGSNTKFVLKDGLRLDLNLESGIVRIDPETNNLLYNEKIYSHLNTMFNTKNIYKGFLHGYNILPKYDYKAKFKSFNFLKEYENLLIDGTRFNTSIGGQIITVERNRSSDADHWRTIKRQVNVKSKMLMETQRELCVGQFKIMVNIGNPKNKDSEYNNYSVHDEEDQVGVSTTEDKDLDGLDEMVVDEITYDIVEDD